MKKISWSYRKNEVLHNMFVADKNKPITFFSYHSKEAWIDFLSIVILPFCQNLEGNGLVTYFLKLHISA